MPGSHTVRRARSADLSIIVAHNRAMAQETEGLDLDPAVAEAGARGLLEDPGKGFYLVAEHNERPVGQLMITTEWSDWRNGEFWWIQSVYVRPEARRTGVYRALHDHVVELAQASGKVCGIRLYVARDNAAARATYQALGMNASHYDLYEVDFVIDRGG
jgi:ribosomal protein S18 acetylase RimI-like enzyme